MARRMAGAPGHCSACGAKLDNPLLRRCCDKCRERSKKYWRDRRASPQIGHMVQSWPKRLAHEVNSLPSTL